MRLLYRFVILVALSLVPAPAPGPSLAGIAHVAFRVTDVPRSRDFYEALGFSQAFEFNDPGKPPVSYLKINDRQFLELYGGADSAHPPALLHVCYEVADIESLVREYAARGLNPPTARQARAGNMLLLLHDPEGKIVEFTQYLPGSLHFEDRGKHLGEHPISRHLVVAGFAVQDLSAETAFYADKLAFKIVAGTDRTATLSLPGNSAEEITLQSTVPESKARIVFETPSLSQAQEKLQKAGLAVKSSENSLEFSDPDGTFIVLVSENAQGDKTH